MSFGNLSNNQRILVLLELLGGPKYAASMSAASAQTLKFRRAQQLANREMALTTRRTWLQNQALFTMRRYAFYGTLAIAGLTAAVFKLGFSYLDSMRTARVALRPFFRDQGLLNRELQQLFTLSKYSPFVLSDLTVAFRQMYFGLHPLGIEGPKIITILTALTNLMSASGRTSPGAMQRLSLAIQHMAYAGRVTGYAVQQLSRLGIPVLPILKQFGITDVRNVSKQNIPAQDFLNAVIAYGRRPEYRNAARRQALQTVSGMIQVMRDTISQVSGNALRGSYGTRNTGVLGLMSRLFAPGGSFDKISAAKGFENVVKAINRQVTGGTGLASGLMLLLSIARNLGLVFARIVVPAFILGLHSLIIFWPALKLVNFGLGLMAKHATLLKYVFAILAAEFIITHSAMMSLWIAQKLFVISTFGTIGPLKNMIKYIRILRMVEILGLITRLKEWAFATKMVWVSELTLERTAIFSNTSFLARVTRAMFGLSVGLTAVAAGFRSSAIWAARMKYAILGWLGYLAAAVIYIRELNSRVNPSHQEVHFIGGKWDPITWLAKPAQLILGNHNQSSGGRTSIAPMRSALPAGAGATAMRGITVHSQLVVDRKVLAEAVARANADRKSLR